MRYYKIQDIEEQQQNQDNNNKRHNNNNNNNNNVDEYNNANSLTTDNNNNNNNTNNITYYQKEGEQEEEHAIKTTLTTTRTTTIKDASSSSSLFVDHKRKRLIHLFVSFISFLLVGFVLVISFTDNHNNNIYQKLSNVLLNNNNNNNKKSSSSFTPNLQIKLINEYGNVKNDVYPFLSSSDVLFMEPYRKTKVHLLFDTDADDTTTTTPSSSSSSSSSSSAVIDSDAEDQKRNLHHNDEEEDNNNNNNNKRKKKNLFEDEMFYEFEITIDQSQQKNTNTKNDKSLHAYLIERNVNTKNKIVPRVKGEWLNTKMKKGTWIDFSEMESNEGEGENENESEDHSLTVGMIDDNVFRSLNTFDQFHIKINMAPSLNAFKKDYTESEKSEAEEVKSESESESSPMMIYEKSYPLAVKYIRRELRTLSAEEKEEFLDAMYEISHLTKSEGIAKYGNCFTNIDHFAADHVNKAGAHNCDHAHEGMAFLNFHNKITIEYEKVLQCINSKLSMSYWDFTIDSTEYERQEDGLSKLSKTWLTRGVFTEEWFGSADPATGKIMNSRWKDMKMGSRTSESKIFNAYEHLRAPWNLNPSEYITRYATQCGDDLAADTSNIQFPTCTSHYEMISNKDYSLSDWNTKIQLAPHGPIHVLTGGMFGCQDSFDAGLNLGFSKEEVSYIKANSFRFLKQSYRDEVMDCPHMCSDKEKKAKECFCTCTSHLENPDQVKQLLVALLAEKYDTISASHDKDDITALLASVCKSPIYLGDQIESGAPSDPTFWPMHGTLERLYQYKRISSDFTDMTWKDMSNGECTGHGENDLLSFAHSYYAEESETTSTTTLSNLEFIASGDPTNENQYQLNYIYDNFEWNHCSQFEK